MKHGKKNIYLLAIISCIILSGCGEKQVTQTQSTTPVENSYTQSYEITGGIYADLNFNGNIISENIKNITTTRSGIIQSLNCEAGTKVHKKDIIAIITPDTNDVNYQNIQVQRNSINDQINNLKGVISFTENNYQAQISQLNNQKDNNKSQLIILNKNIDNLRKTQQFSTGDISTQIKGLQDQISYLNESKNLINKNIELLKENKDKDNSKLNKNIDNINKQLYNTLADCLEKIDGVFGFTEKNKDKNDGYENYLSVKNTSLKNKVESDFWSLKNKLGGFDQMSNETISQFVSDISTLLKNAADSVNSSVASSTFSQSQIDSYYSLFVNLANTSTSSILSTKTSLDNMSASLKTTENSYDNQITSLQNQLTNIDSNIQTLLTNIDNLKSNKEQSSLLSIDSNINTLLSQIQTLESSNKNIEQQINGINESKNIQLNNLQNQILSLNQNLKTLGNNATGETLYAGIDGIIKGKKADINNKVSGNTLLCQIAPNTSEGLKMQIYTPKQMEIGQTFSYSKDGTLIGTGKFETELPYKDSFSQNFIYETNIFNTKLKEGDRITIKLTEKKNGGTIWIPIQYISPKLDGYYVSLKENDSKTNNHKIEVGTINNGYIQILSGLNKGDIIIK